jgi:hypothetical protein
VDLDLAHELLLGAALGQRGLLHHLRSLDHLALLVLELVALCEPSLPEKFSF